MQILNRHNCRDFIKRDSKNRSIAHYHDPRSCYIVILLSRSLFILAEMKLVWVVTFLMFFPIGSSGLQCRKGLILGLFQLKHLKNSGISFFGQFVRGNTEVILFFVADMLDYLLFRHAKRGRLAFTHLQSFRLL